MSPFPTKILDDNEIGFSIAIDGAFDIVDQDGRLLDTFPGASFQAFDREGNSLGVFRTRAEARAAIIKNAKRTTR